MLVLAVVNVRNPNESTLYALADLRLADQPISPACSEAVIT
jgi:hypothetical protein